MQLTKHIIIVFFILAYVDGDIDVTIPIPLSHEAAHHKIAVRPKKTRAAGNNRRIQHVSVFHFSMFTKMKL